MSQSNQHKELNEGYIKAVNEIACIFASKQDLFFTGWVGAKSADIGKFENINPILGRTTLFFNVNDIITDLHTNQESRLIVKWSKETATNHFEGKETITYQSYATGLRY